MEEKGGGVGDWEQTKGGTGSETSSAVTVVWRDPVQSTAGQLAWQITHKPC